VGNTTQSFGGYEVTLLRDGVFELPTQALLHAEGESALQKLLSTRAGGFPIDVNCFLVKGPNGITLVDAGLGATWGETFGKAREILHEAGIMPDQVDRVLVTHIHSDHVLGLFDGAEPWLPRAEILVPDADWAFFTDPAAREAQPEARREPFDFAARLAHAYEGRVSPIPPGPVAAMPDVALLPLPGHTPGHSGYLFRGPQNSLLLWADTVHLQDVQTADPLVCLMFDVDPVQARKTRQATLEQVANGGWIVAGGHVSGFGRIERAEDAYRFVPA